MTPHMPHGVLAWTIAAYYLAVLPIGLAVHWWRNRPDKSAHPPTGVLPLVEGRRVSTLHPGGPVKPTKEPPYDFFYRLPPRAGVRAMFDPGKGTRP